MKEIEAGFKYYYLKNEKIIHINGSNMEAIKEENIFLKQELANKDKIIKNLRNTIDMIILKEKINKLNNIIRVFELNITDFNEAHSLSTLFIQKKQATLELCRVEHELNNPNWENNKNEFNNTNGEDELD